MEFGYATAVDDIFETPAKREDWTEDDVEEGRPLLRVGSWYRGGVCVRLRLRPIGATVPSASDSSPEGYAFESRIGH